MFLYVLSYLETSGQLDLKTDADDSSLLAELASSCELFADKKKKQPIMYLHCHNTELQEAQRTINEGIHPEGYYDAVTADHHTSVTA